MSAPPVPCATAAPAARRRETATRRMVVHHFRLDHKDMGTPCAFGLVGAFFGGVCTRGSLPLLGGHSQRREGLGWRWWWHRAAGAAVREEQMPEGALIRDREIQGVAIGTSNQILRSSKSNKNRYNMVVSVRIWKTKRRWRK